MVTLEGRLKGKDKHQYKFSKRAADRIWMLTVSVKYPKLLILMASIVAAYFLFDQDSVKDFFAGLSEYGYVSVFVGGMLFAFGFTAAFGIGIIAVTSGDVSMLLGAAAGGFGALLSDFILFRFVRVTFEDEFERIKNSKTFVRIDGVILGKFRPKIQHYIVLALAGGVIASPLPDEIGVMMLAASTTVSPKAFASLSFALNSIGILLVLEIASLI